jgi:hypothetical protein
MGWTIPQQWRFKTVAVLASGPSMSQQLADRLRSMEMPTIVVNDTYRLAPWADVLYAADAGWWTTNPREFKGMKVSCSQVPGVLQLRNAGKVGYSDEADCVHTYGNSGAQAIQIAAKAGAARILLYGFDMRGGHWHGEHAFPLRKTSLSSYRVWVEEMKTLAKALTAREVDVLNCTPGSALMCFRFEAGITA